MNPAEIRHWTTRNLLAREAYRADEAARNGVCVTCEARPRSGVKRDCGVCAARKVKQRKAARS